MTTPQETPAALPPLCTAPEFPALLQQFVADFAPQLFALVEEAGERMDGRIVAWGMEFDDHAELAGVGGEIRGSFSCADSARQVLSYSHRGTMHLVWCHAAGTESSQGDRLAGAGAHLG